MSGTVDHLAGSTFHARRGGVANAFRYSVDYVVLDAEAPVRGPALFGRGRSNLMSLHDRDFGGPPGRGRGALWVREALAARGLDPAVRILLLAQPRVLGHVFNPVSFWLVLDARGALRVVIAEVTNTFGDRHAYLCHREDRAPIGRGDTLEAAKTLHVSPFQEVSGQYRFRFDIRGDRIGIRIDYRDGARGVVTSLTGPRRPLRNRTILWACLRRPFGSRRVLGLIHWQAVRLWWKGATFRARPEPPADGLSR